MSDPVPVSFISQVEMKLVINPTRRYWRVVKPAEYALNDIIQFLRP